MWYFFHMKTVQMSLDEALLSEVDEAAAVGGETHSAFIRAALHAELKRRHAVAAEEAHRQSYLSAPEADAPMPGRRAWGE